VSCTRFCRTPDPPVFGSYWQGAIMRAGSGTLRPATVVARCPHLIPLTFALFSPSSHLKIISGSPIMPMIRLAGPAAAPSASVAASFGIVSLLLFATIIRSLFLR
jgi:hypothetical protein